MERRLLDFERDSAKLLAMHRVTWEINFPGQDMSALAFLQSLRSGARRREVYVYELDGQVVAELWLELIQPQLGAHIRQLQVDQDYWGQGIGKCLTQDAIALARGAGAPHLTLNVTKSNLRAMRLYEGLGFTVDEDLGERQRMKLVL